MPYTTYVPPTDYQGKQLVPVRLHPISEPRVVGQQGTTLPQSAIPPYGQLFPPTRWFTDIVVPPIVYDEAVLFGTFPTATVGVPYVYDLFLAGGDGSWSNPRAIVGALPAWATLSIVSGKLRLSGTPTGSAATVSITVAVDSGDGQTASSAQSFGVVIGPYVSSLLRFEGANNSTSFIDDVGNSWVAVDSAVISTARAKFGSSSGRFPEFGCVRAIYNSNFDLLSGAFTLECFVYRDDALQRRIFVLGGSALAWNTTTGSHLALTVTNTGILRLELPDGSSTSIKVDSAAGVATTGAWKHMAICYDAHSARIYWDGIRVAETLSPPIIRPSADPIPCIGRIPAQGTGADWLGNVDAFRITKGAAIYTGSSFTPPTTPFAYP